MKAIWKANAFVRFILTSSLLYFTFYLIYQFVVRKYTHYDNYFIGTIIVEAEYILKILGFKTFKVLQSIDFNLLGIDGSTGVWVGANCNGITLFGLFSVFIIAYPGAFKNKIWFVPIGILLIHLLNIFRVAGLAVLARYFPQYLDFNHTYTFTFLVYGFIFCLWLIWVNRFSKIKAQNV